MAVLWSLLSIQCLLGCGGRGRREALQQAIPLGLALLEGLAQLGALRGGKFRQLLGNLKVEMTRLAREPPCVLQELLGLTKGLLAYLEFLEQV